LGCPAVLAPNHHRSTTGTGLGILRWTVPVFVEGAAEETFRIVIVLDERRIFSSFGDILPDLRVIDD